MSHTSPTVPVTSTRAFWTVVAYAVVLGLVGGLVAVVFIGLIDWIVELVWSEPSGVGFFDGEPWWILLIAGFGLLIGVIRRVLKVEPVIPGLFDEIAERRVEPTTVPKRVLVAFVSLLSGASVGPEAPLGAMGGGLGTWLSERQGLSDELREANTLSGMAGMFGGFFTSPLVSAILVIEAAKPSGPRNYVMTWIPVIIAATVGFAVFITISGGTLLGLYDLPEFEVNAGSFLLAVPLGLLGALIAALLGLTMGMVHRLTLPLRTLAHRAGDRRQPDPGAHRLGHWGISSWISSHRCSRREAPSDAESAEANAKLLGYVTIGTTNVGANNATRRHA